MSETDPKPYPETGPLAVLARLALLAAIAVIAYATIGGGSMIRLLYSSNLEHFAAFYLAALAAALAMPRAGLWRLAVGLTLFAAVMEGARMIHGDPPVLFQRWCADVGGIMAALAPIVAERFRQMVRRPTA